MLATLNVLFMGLVLGGLPAWVIWGWVTLLRNRAVPSRARLTSLLGLAFTSTSAALEVGAVLYAQVSGVGPAGVPVPLHVTGLVLAGLGLALSLLGARQRTTLRWTTPALSLVMLAIWLLNVCSQDL